MLFKENEGKCNYTHRRKYWIKMDKFAQVKTKSWDFQINNIFNQPKKLTI